MIFFTAAVLGVIMSPSDKSTMIKTLLVSDFLIDEPIAY